MSIRRYTHIFFDLDNTLWDFKANSFDALHLTFLYFNIGEQCGDYQMFFDVFTKYNDILWSEYRNKKLSKKELKRLRFQNTFEELNIPGIDPLETDEFYLNEIPKQKKLVRGTIELLDHLRHKGYLMYIITNGFREVQHKKLQNSGLSEYFSRVYISEEIKAPKPNTEIFEYAVKSSNARKRNSLMVGDDWDSDIAGALNFGIDAVYYCPSSDCSVNAIAGNTTSRNNVYAVGTLSDLIQIL
jgi:putative hydrolase of the HAD superfamily